MIVSSRQTTKPVVDVNNIVLHLPRQNRGTVNKASPEWQSLHDVNEAYREEDNHLSPERYS